MTAAELARDDQFRKNWPYCAARLEKYLTQRQLEFAAANKGEYEKIGRYVEFQQQLFDSLADLNALMQERPAPTAAPKKLHNVHFQPDKTPVVPKPQPT